MQPALPLAPHLAPLAWLKSATELSDSRIAGLLRVTRQTLTRWRNGEAIDAGKRRYLLAVRDVLERAAQNCPTPQERGVRAKERPILILQDCDIVADPKSEPRLEALVCKVGN